MSLLSLWKRSKLSTRALLVVPTSNAVENRQCATNSDHRNLGETVEMADRSTRPNMNPLQAAAGSSHCCLLEVVDSFLDYMSCY